MLKPTIRNNLPTVEQVMKSINFGTARGVTWTAKDAQTAIITSLGNHFTLRGNWMQPSNRFGIRIKPATKTDLKAEVYTAADWLLLHEEGGDKHGRGGSLAVPTDEVRRTKRMIIPRGQRPKGLGAKAFKLMTKRGPVLAQRITRGKRKGLIILYGLEKSVHIKKRPTFYGPGQAAVNKFLERNVNKSISQALADIK
jgi:hypothetical protein